MRGAIDYVLYCLLHLAVFSLRLLPLAVLRPMLEGMARCVALVDRKHTRIARNNLAVAFPQASARTVERTVTQAFRNWGRLAAELIRARSLIARPRPDWVARGESLVRTLPPGGGLLVLTAHTANIDLLARTWACATGREIAIFHRPFSNRFVERFLRRERERMGVRALGRGTAVREALRVLARGGIVAVPLDQNQPPGRPGVFVDFFGKPAATATVLARLSLFSGAPVVPVFAVWQGKGLSALLGSPLDPGGLLGEQALERATRRRAILELTQRYTKEIEAVILKHPGQWNWAHQRWKTRPQQ